MMNKFRYRISFLYSAEFLILSIQNTDFNRSQVASMMGLNLQIKKLQEVISLILDENIIKKDEDLEVAEEIKEVFQKHIDLVDTYKILHQSTKHNIQDLDEYIEYDGDGNYQDSYDCNVGESKIKNEEENGVDIDVADSKVMKTDREVVEGNVCSLEKKETSSEECWDGGART